MCTDHRHTRHWYGGNRTSEHQDGLRVCDAAILRSTDEGPSPALLAQHGTAPHGKAHTDSRAHPFPADAVAGPEAVTVIHELCRLRHTALHSGFPFCI